MHISMATCHYLQLYLWVSFSDHGGGVVKVELHLFKKKKKNQLRIKNCATTTGPFPPLPRAWGLRHLAAGRGLWWLPPCRALGLQGAGFSSLLPFTLLKIGTFRRI